MRNDMSKVIVERPRVGGQWSKAKKNRRVDPDLLHANEGMRAPHVRHYGGKELNENLAPLRRFLGQQIGRRWDDVYSEISENLKVSNTVQQHVRDHVKDFVGVKTFVKDGEIWVHGYRLSKLSDSWHPFYVDPIDGILKENTFRKTSGQRSREYKEAAQAKKMETERDLPDGTYLRKVGGIWYAGVYENTPAPIKKSYINNLGNEVVYYTGGSAWDVLLGKNIYHPSKLVAAWGDRSAKYCVSKRQLNHEELKKHGLKND